ncbi:MAG: inositol monophosphatase [Anaerolineae bacterium]|nr:inositol monophosphatase [Anaerolineae bacterium]
MDYRSWLQVALEAANEAGEFLRSHWRQAHTIRQKGFRDIVTEADIESERIILTHLRAAFPQHAITSEESGADAGEVAVRWMVDPLDGTTNYSRGNPNFSITIAAIEEGHPVLGVIYDPLRNHTFTAIRGSGAMLNGDAIHVSNTTELASAIFAVDSPRDPDERQQMWAYIERLLQSGRTMRASGSAALNLAYVAAGWIDLYTNLHLFPWDQAAGGLLVQEAGGAMSTVAGLPWTPYRADPLAAASQALLDAFHRMQTEESK